MKHLIPFKIYESQETSGPTKKQEEFLNRYTRGTWSVNPTTGLVDVQGDFNCSSERLESLLDISFGHVSGDFDCSNNQLTSLEGAPQTVDGDFHCFNNQLTSLEGAPNTVSEDFVCLNNRLTSLEGAPHTVNGNFFCQYNQLTSLKGAPQTVDGGFFCSNNQLTSLEGAPQTVDGGFYCVNNRLTSLKGAPQTVGGDFKCDEFELDQGKWNMEGWLEVLDTGSEEAKKLILTLLWLQPDWLNSELQRDPGKTVHLLATAWNHMPKDMQSAIKIPKGHEDDFELFSGFDELGLF